MLVVVGISRPSLILPMHCGWPPSLLAFLDVVFALVLWGVGLGCSSRINEISKKKKKKKWCPGAKRTSSEPRLAAIPLAAPAFPLSSSYSVVVWVPGLHWFSPVLSMLSVSR